MTTKEHILTNLHRELDHTQTRINILNSISELDQLEFYANFYSGAECQIDFDNLKHDEVIKVIAAVGGKWEKTLSIGAVERINYQTTKNGVTYRCWQGEPPPNCKIIDVIETIPAQAERTITRKRLVCQ